MRTSRELFWKHGFRRVTVEEICEKASVSKMTFYRYFTNKIELAKTVFNNVVDKGVIDFRKIMQEDIAVSEKLKKIILLKEEGTTNVSKEFMADFYSGSEPELKNYVEEKTRLIWKELRTDFKEAQEKGIFRRDFKPEFFVHVVFKLTDLLNDEALLELYDTPQELILEFTKIMTYGILPHEK